MRLAGAIGLVTLLGCATTQYTPEIAHHPDRFGYVTSQSEEDGLERIQRLSVRERFEDAWFYSEEGLWVEAGTDEGVEARDGAFAMSTTTHFAALRRVPPPSLHVHYHPLSFSLSHVLRQAMGAERRRNATFSQEQIGRALEDEIIFSAAPSSADFLVRMPNGVEKAVGSPLGVAAYSLNDRKFASEEELGDALSNVRGEYRLSIGPPKGAPPPADPHLHARNVAERIARVLSRIDTASLAASAESLAASLSETGKVEVRFSPNPLPLPDRLQLEQIVSGNETLYLLAPLQASEYK